MCLTSRVLPPLAGLALLPASLTLADRLVQTRLQPDITLQPGHNSLSLEAEDFFRRFSDSGPLVEFTINLPIQDERGVVSLKAGNNGPFSVMTYETLSGVDYTDLNAVTGNDLKRREEKIRVRLLPEQAPVTVANFLQYVEEGAYDRTFIHRAPIQYSILQGGSYFFDGELVDYITTRAPIALEAIASHQQGTLAMARTSNPDSATSGWFFNSIDNSELWDDLGYAVFGQTTAEDLNLLTELQAVATWNTSSLGLPFDTVPLYTIGWEGPNDFPSSNFVIFETVRLIDGTSDGVAYSLSFSDYDRTRGSVSPDGYGQRLDLSDCVPGSFARATITAAYAGTTRTLEIRLEYPHPKMRDKLGAQLEKPHWYFADWTGWIHAGSAFPWVYRPFIGWQRLDLDAGAGSEAAWVFDARLGWIHDSAASAPWIFVRSLGLWVAFDPRSGPPARRIYVAPGQQGALQGWIDESQLPAPQP